jgi:2-polyprenyl-3-methyl-5-hydroxy-6-metoxy-1,4-benzoquinol methylase
MDISQFINLAYNRKKSLQSYRDFQSYQAELVCDYLLRKGVQIRQKTIIDIGSGIGGFSEYFHSKGARVISIDLIHPRKMINNTGFIMGDGLNLPIRSGSLEFIFCASVIEHVSDPQRIITEIYRALKPGGIVYISFPPFYSLRGGHRYSPFHYFGEQVARRILGDNKEPKWIREIYFSQESDSKNQSISGGWGLNKVTINKFNKIVKSSGLSRLDMSTRYMPVSFIRWPILREVLTWHAQFLFQK